jgi:hypothetical protein
VDRATKPSQNQKAEKGPRPDRSPSQERAAAPEKSHLPARAAPPRRGLPEPALQSPLSRPREPVEERVIGLGDHVPSFLLRPTRAPRPAKVEAED